MIVAHTLPGLDDGPPVEYASPAQPSLRQWRCSGLPWPGTVVVGNNLATEVAGAQAAGPRYLA